jgi:U3 small nucleolar RNA-associated protein 20
VHCCGAQEAACEQCMHYDGPSAHGVAACCLSQMLASLIRVPLLDCREPPLLACAFALSASTYLLPVLGNLPSTLPSQLPTPAAQASSSAASAAKGTEPQGTDAITAALTANAAAALPSPIVLDTAAPPAPWAVQGLGGKLLRSVIAMLNLPSISPASRSGVLDVVENILEAAAQQETLANAVAAVAAVTGSTPAAGTAPQPAPAPAMLVIAAAAQAAGVAPGTGARLVSTVLGPWLDELLVALKGVVLSAWGASAAGPARSDPAAAQRTGHSAMASALVAAGAGRKGRGGAAQGHAHRELGILERLGGQVSSPLTGLLLGDALAGLVSVASSGMGRRGTRAKLDEVRVWGPEGCRAQGTHSLESEISLATTVEGAPMSSCCASVTR